MITSITQDDGVEQYGTRHYVAPEGDGEASTTTVLHRMTTATPPLLMTLWTRDTRSPGEMYQDSGCARSCAGPEVHEAMHRFLAQYGIVPVQIFKREEFLFGDNKVETSDCSFQYPMFLNKRLTGAIDIARLPVPCPGLYSKQMMIQLKHVLDFDKQETRIGAYGLSYPFKDSVPILDIFQMPDKLDVQDIPPRFRAPTHSKNVVRLATSGSERRETKKVKVETQDDSSVPAAEHVQPSATAASSSSAEPVDRSILPETFPPGVSFWKILTGSDSPDPPISVSSEERTDE